MPDRNQSAISPDIGTNDQLLKLVIASGPYTLDTDLEYRIIDELLISIDKDDVDVVILVSTAMIRFAVLTYFWQIDGSIH
jgi:hypothetical protein